MTGRRQRWMLTGASILTLLALALMVWSVLVPTPMPVLIAMSLGQVLGTAAFGLYLWVVVFDLIRIIRERRPRATEEPPP